MRPIETKRATLCGLGLAVWGLCLLGSTGCTTGDVSKELTAQSHPHLPDVPVPAGFDLVEKRSRSYKNQAGLRWVDYLYKGREDKFSVIRFYETCMTAGRWELQTQQMAQGRAALDFAKDHERCRITLSGDGGVNPTYIHVSITPGTHVGPPAQPK